MPRTVVLTVAAFAKGPLSLRGVLRHELGHVLGLRHEHIRYPGTSCTENTHWRAVTQDDSNSMMHYRHCLGSTSYGDLVMTATDAAGLRQLYP